MAQLTNYGENKIADFMRGQGLTFANANWHAQLDSAGDDASATALTGTGIARVAIARTLAAWAGTQGAGTTLASSGTSHGSSNNAAISWGTPGSAWGTANQVSLWDASSGGNRWMWFPISPIVITTGAPDPVQLDAGALAFTLGLIGGMSDYLANKLIDLIFRGQAFTWPATVYPNLYTVAPTNAGGGTEVAASGYARASLVPSLSSLSGTQSAGSTAASSGTGGRISNNSSIAFPAAFTATVVAEGIMDAATVGNLLFWKAIAPKSFRVAGAPPQHAANTLGLTAA